MIWKHSFARRWPPTRGPPPGPRSPASSPSSSDNPNWPGSSGNRTRLKYGTGSPRSLTPPRAVGRSANDLDPDLVFDTIVGAVQFRLIFHQHLKDRFVDDLANLILTGAAAPVG